MRKAIQGAAKLFRGSVSSTCNNNNTCGESVTKRISWNLEGLSAAKLDQTWPISAICKFTDWCVQMCITNFSFD